MARTMINSSSSSSVESSFSMISCSSKWWWVPRTRSRWIRILGGQFRSYGRLVGLCGGGRLAPFKFLMFVSFLGCYFFGRGSSSTMYLITLTLYSVLFCVNCIESAVADYKYCKRFDAEKRMEVEELSPSFMDSEENKQDDTKSIPYVQLDMVDSDYAFALALQEQETALTSFTMSESDSSEDDDDDDDEEGANEGDDDDYNGNPDEEDGDEIFEAELDLDEEDHSNDEDMEEDDIDPDELSYEGLIALGEIVGSENKGLSMDEITSYLSPYAYKSQLEHKYGVDQCVICQTVCEEEEPVMTLPCDHTYHSDCISKWLQIKKVCPICNSEVSSALFKAET